MRYQKLKLMSDDLLTLARKFSTGVKKNDVDAAANLHLTGKYESGLRFGMMMEDFVLAEEDYWRHRSKRRVLFPSSEDFLHQLMCDDFNLTHAEGFSLPFDSFVLAMPRGFTIDGIEIPTCLVTWVGAADHVDTVLGGYLKRLGQPEADIRLKSDDVDQKSLSILTQTRDGAFSRVMSYSRVIPELLKTKDISEYRELVGNLSDQTIATDLDEYESKQQYLLLRLVAAVGVYAAACGDQGGLCEGLRNPAHKTSVLPKSVKTLQPYTLHEIAGAAGAEKSVFEQVEAELTAEPDASKKPRWVIVRNPHSNPLDFD